MLAIIAAVGPVIYATENNKQKLGPQYPYEIHSMQDMRALTDYFFRDLESKNSHAVTFGLMHLEMMDEVHPRLLAYLRKAIPERIKGLNPSDNVYLSNYASTLVRIGREEDLKLLQELTSTNMITQHILTENAMTLAGNLQRVREGKPRFGIHNKAFGPEEYPPETSPLSKPIPPLVVKKEEEPPPPPVKPLQQPVVKQAEPLPIHVEDHSWMLWLLAVFAALSGLFWLMRKPVK